MRTFLALNVGSHNRIFVLQLKCRPTGKTVPSCTGAYFCRIHSRPLYCDTTSVPSLSLIEGVLPQKWCTISVLFQVIAEEKSEVFFLVVVLKFYGLQQSDVCFNYFVL